MSNDLAAPPAPPEPRVGHYELLGTIGQGSFGKVRRARHVLTGAEVAVKAIPTQQGFAGRPRLRVQEVDSLTALRHPNIVTLFEVISTKHVVYVVMEHVTGGDLWEHLLTHGVLSESEARGVFRQLVSAVHHCHGKGIVHRDLKPSNVLLEPGLKVKVTDFGLSAPFHKRTLSTYCGTPSYVAPEVFLEQRYDGPPVDVWSLGVLLFKMVSGHVPFEEVDPVKLRQLILKGDYTMPSYFTPSLQHLVTKLITLNPKKRKSLEDFMTDAWLNAGEEELRPYREPPPEATDPCVIEEMVDMGFQVDLIQKALNKKTYDYLMATYLLLKRSRPEVQYRTIRVRPVHSPDDDDSPGPSPAQEPQPQCSRLQTTEQQSQDREPGQTAQEVGPAASVTSRTTAPGASPKPTTATGRPSLKTSTPTPGPSPKLWKASARPSQKWAKVIPRHSPKLRTATPRPSPKSRTATSRPGPKWRKASPLTIRDSVSRPTTPPPIHDSEVTSVTPPPIQDSEVRPVTPPSIKDSEVRPITPPHMQDSDSRIITPPANTASKSHTSIPPPIPELETRTATPPPSPESSNTTPSPAPQCGPGSTQSGLSSSSSSKSSKSRSPEGSSQGRRGLARRCLAWLQKLCLCSCMKGRGKRNRVTPL